MPPSLRTRKSVSVNLLSSCQQAQLWSMSFLNLLHYLCCQVLKFHVNCCQLTVKLPTSSIKEHVIPESAAFPAMPWKVTVKCSMLTVQPRACFSQVAYSDSFCHICRHVLQDCRGSLQYMVQCCFLLPVPGDLLRLQDTCLAGCVCESVTRRVSKGLLTMLTA